MSINKFDATPATLSRLAGALYLAIAVSGGFSIAYVPSVIVVEGDALATTTNLAAHSGLFRLGILADIALILFEICLTSILYTLFRNYGPTLSMAAALSRIGMVLVMAVNLMLSVLAASAAMALSDPSHAQDFVMTMFEARAIGVFVWQLFFGLHLVALGWLIVRSKLVPKLLGWGLAIGAFGYTLQGIAELTLFENQIINVGILGLLTIVTLSEISFGLWLLIKGTKPATSASRSSFSQLHSIEGTSA